LQTDAQTDRHITATKT